MAGYTAPKSWKHGMVEVGPKIFAYITGDEQQVLKDHGLL